MDVLVNERRDMAAARAAALHRVGTLDAMDMRDMDMPSLPPRPDHGGLEIKQIRAARA